MIMLYFNNFHLRSPMDAYGCIYSVWMHIQCMDAYSVWMHIQCMDAHMKFMNAHSLWMHVQFMDVHMQFMDACAVCGCR